MIKHMMWLQLVPLLLIVTFYFDNMLAYFARRLAPIDELHVIARITFNAIRLAISLFVAYFLIIMFAITFVSIYL